MLLATWVALTFSGLGRQRLLVRKRFNAFLNNHPQPGAYAHG